MNRNNSGNIGCFAMGCLGVIAVCVILGIVAVGAGFYVTDRLVKQFTDTAPMELTPVAMAEADVAPVQERLDNFVAAVKADEQVEPLTLTEDEVNGLLQYDSDFEPIGKYIRVDIAEAGTVNGEISLPLNALKIPSQGGGGFNFMAYGDRYLNGKGKLEVFLRNGRLYIHPVSFEIKGEPVSEEIMKEIRSENMVYWADPEGNSEPFAAKLDRIELGENSVTLVPKPKDAAATEAPADSAAPQAAPEAPADAEKSVETDAQIGV